jgi:hypothetical protein
MINKFVGSVNVNQLLRRVNPLQAASSNFIARKNCVHHPDDGNARNFSAGLKRRNQGLSDWKMRFRGYLWR